MAPLRPRSSVVLPADERMLNTTITISHNRASNKGNNLIPFVIEDLDAEQLWAYWQSRKGSEAQLQKVIHTLKPDIAPEFDAYKEHLELDKSYVLELHHSFFTALVENDKEVMSNIWLKSPDNVCVMEAEGRVYAGYKNITQMWSNKLRQQRTNNISMSLSYTNTNFNYQGDYVFISCEASIEAEIDDNDYDSSTLTYTLDSNNNVVPKKGKKGSKKKNKKKSRQNNDKLYITNIYKRPYESDRYYLTCHLCSMEKSSIKGKKMTPALKKLGNPIETYIDTSKRKPQGAVGLGAGGMSIQQLLGGGLMRGGGANLVRIGSMQSEDGDEDDEEEKEDDEDDDEDLISLNYDDDEENGIEIDFEGDNDDIVMSIDTKDVIEDDEYSELDSEEDYEELEAQEQAIRQAMNRLTGNSDGDDGDDDDEEDGNGPGVMIIDMTDGGGGTIRKSIFDSSNTKDKDANNKSKKMAILKALGLADGSVAGGVGNTIIGSETNIDLLSKELFGGDNRNNGKNSNVVDVVGTMVDNDTSKDEDSNGPKGITESIRDDLCSRTLMTIRYLYAKKWITSNQKRIIVSDLLQRSVTAELCKAEIAYSLIIEHMNPMQLTSKLFEKKLDLETVSHEDLVDLQEMLYKIYEMEDETAEGG